MADHSRLSAHRTAAPACLGSQPRAAGQKASGVPSQTTSAGLGAALCGVQRVAGGLCWQGEAAGQSARCKCMRRRQQPGPAGMQLRGQHAAQL